jgi:hypothetical protein
VRKSTILGECDNAVLGEIRDDVCQRAAGKSFELGGHTRVLIVRAIQLLDGEQEDRVPALVGSWNGRR